MFHAQHRSKSGKCKFQVPVFCVGEFSSVTVCGWNDLAVLSRSLLMWWAGFNVSTNTVYRLMVLFRHEAAPLLQLARTWLWSSPALCCSVASDWLGPTSTLHPSESVVLPRRPLSLVPVAGVHWQVPDTVDRRRHSRAFSVEQPAQRGEQSTSPRSPADQPRRSTLDAVDSCREVDEAERQMARWSVTTARVTAAERRTVPPETTTTPTVAASPAATRRNRRTVGRRCLRRQHATGSCRSSGQTERPRTPRHRSPDRRGRYDLVADCRPPGRCMRYRRRPDRPPCRCDAPRRSRRAWPVDIRCRRAARSPAWRRGGRGDEREGMRERRPADGRRAWSVSRPVRRGGEVTRPPTGRRTAPAPVRTRTTSPSRTPRRTSRRSRSEVRATSVGRRRTRAGSRPVLSSPSAAFWAQWVARFVGTRLAVRCRRFRVQASPKRHSGRQCVPIGPSARVRWFSDRHRCLLCQGRLAGWDPLVGRRREGRWAVGVVVGTWPGDLWPQRGVVWCLFHCIDCDDDGDCPWRTCRRVRRWHTTAGDPCQQLQQRHNDLCSGMSGTICRRPTSN